MIGDMKIGLTSAKPKLSILPRHGLVYAGRPIEYGADKYARGNYHGPGLASLTPAQRVLGYLDAALRHITETSQALNVALGTGSDAATACSTVDNEASGRFPASGLPHLAHAIASLLIGVEVAVAEGLLPADPGRPWDAARGGSATVDCPQKDDPAAERARVAAFGEGRDAAVGPITACAEAVLARRDLPL